METSKICGLIVDSYDLETGWAVIEGERYELLDNDDEDRFEEDYECEGYMRVYGPDGDDALYQADKWVRYYL